MKSKVGYGTSKCVLNAQCTWTELEKETKESQNLLYTAESQADSNNWDQFVRAVSYF
jgi:hypothetical protein